MRTVKFVESVVRGQPQTTKQVRILLDGKQIGPVVRWWYDSEKAADEAERTISQILTQHGVTDEEAEAAYAR